MFVQRNKTFDGFETTVRQLFYIKELKTMNVCEVEEENVTSVLHLFP